MKQVTSISVAELQEMAAKMYGSFAEADVDIAKGIHRDHRGGRPDMEREPA